MKIKLAPSRKVFIVFNYAFLSATTILCLVPLINVLAVSFSTSWAAQGGLVSLWPVRPTLASYEYVMRKPEFLTGLLVSFERTGLGTAVNIVLSIMAGYALSKDKHTLRIRGVYSWFFLVTILFSGGLIPLYITISMLGMMDSLWALILPGAVPVFNVILLMNFFRQLPKEIGESAYIDGAGHWMTLWKIVVPLSMPSIATVILFSAVGHWNSWFDGLIFMNDPKHYPLQSYLQTIIATVDGKIWGNGSHLTLAEVQLLSQVNDRTTKASQVFLAVIPILCVYPFLQRYFMTGIVLGSVKG